MLHYLILISINHLNIYIISLEIRKLRCMVGYFDYSFDT